MEFSWCTVVTSLFAFPLTARAPKFFIIVQLEKNRQISMLGARKVGHLGVV